MTLDTDPDLNIKGLHKTDAIKIKDEMVTKSAMMLYGEESTRRSSELKSNKIKNLIDFTQEVSIPSARV